MRFDVPEVIYSITTERNELVVIGLRDRHVVHFDGIVPHDNLVWVAARPDLPLLE